MGRGEGGGEVSVTGHDDEVLHRLQFGNQRLQYGDEVWVDEDDLVFGMVDYVDQVLGEQPDVYRVEHRTHGWRGEIDLQMPVGVPGECPHPVSGAHSQPCEGMGQAGRPFHQVGIGITVGPVSLTGHDLLVGEESTGTFQELVYQKGVVHHGLKRLR